MKIQLTYLVLFLSFAALFGSPINCFGQITVESRTDTLYEGLGLEGILDYEIFQKALEGMDEYEFEKTHLLTIIDYTKASHRKRMFVINLENEKLLKPNLINFFV